MSRVAPFLFFLNPSSPTSQPASSRSFDAIRRFFLSNCFVDETDTSATSLSIIPEGRAFLSEFKIINSSFDGFPVAAISLFSQNEFILAYKS